MPATLVCATALLVGCTEAADTQPGAQSIPPAMNDPGMPTNVPSGAPNVGSEFDCADPAQQDPGPYLIRRLTLPEYGRTVRDALGVDISDLLSQLPADQSSDGFLNNASVQVTSYDHVAGYAKLAAQITSRLPDAAAFVQELSSCRDFSDACKATVLENLALRLYRRPLDELDRAALLPLFDVIAAEAGVFEDAAKLVLEAMLQSPRFLYRVEAQVVGTGAGIRALDGYDLASRLSYLVWGSSPDGALLAAAQAGQLGDAAAIGAQVDRMLAATQAIAGSLDFLDGWLELERLPKLQTELREALRQETEAFFQAVVWEQRAPLTSLLTSKFTYASQELAAFYGLPNPLAGFNRYDLSGVPNRKGLLTQGSVLSSGGAGASLVYRGLFVRENLLCASVPAPPPGVNNGRPEPQPGKSQRAYAEERATTSPCSGCHGMMDPLAFAFTTFDDYGAPQTADPQGNVMVTTGQFVFPYDTAPKAFQNADELIELLAADARVQDCLVLKPARFALGRAVDVADQCTLAAVRNATRAEGLSYQTLVRALATQPALRTIRAE